MDTWFIYKGPGACAVSIKNAFNTCKTLLKDEIAYISPEQVILNQIDGAVLIMPGGRDIPYTRSLKGIGAQNIKHFVESGGTYIGICAGAYFGGSYVSFDEGGPLEVKGERELKFYSGTVKGPIYGEFDYYSLKGASALPIHWTESHNVYFNGGGTFEGGVAETIATYQNGKPAIIETKVGKGKAILSGVHFEYHPDYLDDSFFHIKSKIQKEPLERLQKEILINRVKNLPISNRRY